MRAVLQRGLDSEPTALQMSEAWLHKHPPRSLWKLWKEYAEAVHASVSPTLAELLTAEISGTGNHRCRVIRRRAGIRQGVRR